MEKFNKKNDSTSTSKYFGVSSKGERGFTLIEIIVFIGLASGIMFVVGSFTNDVSSFRNYFDESLAVEEDVSQALSKIISEIRSMAQSNIGNYPIGAASQSSLTFYSNIDGDALFERIRYFVSGNTLRKGVIKPTGSPLEYVTGNETFTDVLNDLATTTIFAYFDSNYTGAEDSLPLPVNIPDIRVIGVTVSVDSNPNQIPGPFTLSKQVTIRNLRSNL